MKKEREKSKLEKIKGKHWSNLIKAFQLRK